MKFLYTGNQGEANYLGYAASELKKSVTYFAQSAAGKDDIDGFLKRLGEYSDSIIVKNTDEGRNFIDGVCILKVNPVNMEIIDICLKFRFQNESGELEERRYTNQISRQNFTDAAYEKLLVKKTMTFEIVR